MQPKENSSIEVEKPPSLAAHSQGGRLITVLIDTGSPVTILNADKVSEGQLNPPDATLFGPDKRELETLDSKKIPLSIKAVSSWQKRTL